MPDVWPQKKKRFVCLMMVTPGVSTAYWREKEEKLVRGFPTTKTEKSDPHLNTLQA